MLPTGSQAVWCWIMQYVFSASNVSCVVPVDGEQRTIFSGLSVDMKLGEIVDLVGPSGSGKSSLLTAFARLNPNANGNFQLEGRSASEFTPQQWRSQVAYLPQKPVLIGSSVAEAIRYRSHWLSVRAKSSKDSAGNGRPVSLSNPQIYCRMLAFEPRLTPLAARILIWGVLRMTCLEAGRPCEFGAHLAYFAESAACR